MEFESGGIRIYDEALDFDDVLIIPRLGDVSSRSEVNLEVEINNWKGIPIIAANMDNIGTFNVSRVLSEYKMLTAIVKRYTLEDYKKESYNPEYVCVSAGISKEDFQNVKSILEYNPEIRWICLDVANGYMESFHNVITEYRKAFPNKHIIAGNVVDGKGSEQIIQAGRDHLIFPKVGIGSGGVCTTRSQTGVGIPQFTAIMNCAVHDLMRFSGKKYSESDLKYYNNCSKNVISDGGCKTPGDISKAFGIGARMVMIGSMLAGYDETGEHLYGMSSAEAMKISDPELSKLSYRSAEGKSVRVSSYSGRPLKEKINDILGGLRSTLSYTGNKELSEYIGNQHFIKVRRILNDIWS
jgi:GMP reductase